MTGWNTHSTPSLELEAGWYFLDQLRAARAKVLSRAEAFHAVIHVLERLGSYLAPGQEGLNQYAPFLAGIASRSPLCHTVPGAWPGYHLSFCALLRHTRYARNAAVHEGAMARHLTAHTIELALVLEDALMENGDTAADFMVRTPVQAYPWQPLSFIRQTMLVNSFSYLPVLPKPDGDWAFISDLAFANYLRVVSSNSERGRRLRERLDSALAGGALELEEARWRRLHHSMTSSGYAAESRSWSFWRWISRTTSPASSATCSTATTWSTKIRG